MVRADPMTVGMRTNAAGSPSCAVHVAGGVRFIVGLATMTDLLVGVGDLVSSAWFLVPVTMFAGFQVWKNRI
jgi:hypothetical protein